MHEMSLTPQRLDGLTAALDPEDARRFVTAMEEHAVRLEGRRIWHVNSAGEGGGVAEILHALLPYLRAFGIDVRWMVIDAEEAFFDLTKRIHLLLHGATRDGDVETLEAGR